MSGFFCCGVVLVVGVDSKSPVDVLVMAGVDCPETAACLNTEVTVVGGVGGVDEADDEVEEEEADGDEVVGGECCCCCRCC